MRRLAIGIEPIVEATDLLALKIATSVTAMESLNTSKDQNSENDTAAIRGALAIREAAIG
jgi:hypothetical protein